MMDLVDFIIAAKVSGYAAAGEARELGFNDGSRGFRFARDGFRYVDRYFGFNPFLGTEYVYDGEGLLIWAMNYYGEVLQAHPYPGEIYSFLREALALLTPQYPFRGPERLAKDNLLYLNEPTGTLQIFSGTETIYEDGDRVYHLHYHGGSMMQKA